MRFSIPGKTVLYWNRALALGIKECSLHVVDFQQCTWWLHQMETFSALLAICAGNSPVPGEFPTQRPVTRSFDVFFDLRPNKRLSKQWWGWWFETQLCPLWRHRNGWALIWKGDSWGFILMQQSIHHVVQGPVSQRVYEAHDSNLLKIFIIIF